MRIFRAVSFYLGCMFLCGFASCVHTLAGKQRIVRHTLIKTTCVEVVPSSPKDSTSVKIHKVSCSAMGSQARDPLSLDRDAGEILGRVFADQSVKVPAGLKAVWVKSKSGPLRADQLLDIAQKTGASVVLARNKDAWVVLTQTLMVQRLSMEPLGELELGSSAPGRIAAATLAHLADEAFYDADFAGACILAGSSLDQLPEKQAACSFSAPLMHMAWMAARSGGCDEDLIMARFKSRCLDTHTDSWNREERDFFATLTELEAARSSAWTKENLPSRYNSAKGKKDSLDRLRSLAKKLDGKRGRLMATLADELEAFTMSPSGPCDQKTPQRRKEKMALAAKNLFALGRADLSSYVPGMATDGGQTYDPDRIMLWQTMVRPADMAWVRMEKMASLFWQLYTDPDFWQHRQEAAGLCKTYLHEVRRRVDQDGWPEHSQRALDILTGASLVYSMCSDRGPLDSELQKILDAIQEKKDGKLRVLLAVAGTLPQVFSNILTGADANGSLAELASMVQGRLKTLGKAPEERALKSCLKTFLIVAPALKGDLLSVVGILEGAEKELYGLPFPPAEDAAAILRVAPGYHLALGYVLVVIDGLLKKNAEFDQVLSRLSPRVKKSISMLLQEAGAQEHIPQATALVAALDSVIQFVFSKDKQKAKSGLDRVFSSVKGAWRPLGEKGDWWNIGLSAADIVLADALALLWKDELGRDKSAKLMDWSTKGIGELVRSAKSWYSLRGPSYDLLELVQAAHAGVTEYFSLARSPERVSETLSGTWNKVKPVLDRLSASRPPAARMKNLLQRGSITDLVMEALWIVRDVGFKKLGRNDPEAVKKVLVRAESLDGSLASGGRRKRQFILETSIAVALALVGMDDLAHSWLDRAIGNADKEGLADTTVYLQAFDSAVWAKENKLAKAREVLRHAMEPAFEAKKCKATHPSMALYLPSAYLAERDGAHELAMAQLDQYLDLTNEGFAGEGKIRCKYLFNSGKAVVQMTLGVALSNVLQSTTTEQSWQIGMGAQSKSLEDEKLFCSNSPVAYRRYDKILLAHGLEAFYSLMHGDDVSADLHLRQMRQDLDTMDLGNAYTMTPFETNGLKFSKDNLYEPLIYWTGVLAQLRGHLADGEALVQVATRSVSGNQKEKMEDLVLNPGDLPAYLRGIDAVGKLQPFMARWLEVSSKGDSLDVRTLAMLKKLHGQLPELVAKNAKDLLEASMLTGAGKMERAMRHLKAFGTGSKQLGPVALLLDAALAYTAGKGLPDSKRLMALVRKCVSAGFSSDALKMVDVLLGAVQKRDGEKAAVALVQATIPKMPDDRSEFRRQVLLLNLYLASKNKSGQLQALEAALAHCKGMVTSEQYFSLQYRTIMTALGLGSFDNAHARITKQLPVFRYAYGDNETVARLTAMEWALRVVLKKDWNANELHSLSLWFDSAGLGGSRSARFLKSAIAAVDAKKDPVELSRRFLQKEASLILGD